MKPSTKTYSASTLDIDKEYVYDSYPLLHKENSPVYGVDTVYMYDFRTDGESEDTNIKADIHAQEFYDGPDKVKSLGCAECNYIYGELVTRHLTNLNDWVTGKVGSGDDITYLNLYQEAVTVPNLHEPFLFLINKDNQVDNSSVVRGSDYANERGTYPIISAIELECCRDEKDGRLLQQ